MYKLHQESSQKAQSSSIISANRRLHPYEKKSDKVPSLTEKAYAKSLELEYTSAKHLKWTYPSHYVKNFVGESDLLEVQEHASIALQTLLEHSSAQPSAVTFRDKSWQSDYINKYYIALDALRMWQSAGPQHMNAICSKFSERGAPNHQSLQKMQQNLWEEQTGLSRYPRNPAYNAFKCLPGYQFTGYFKYLFPLVCYKTPIPTHLLEPSNIKKELYDAEHVIFHQGIPRLNNKFRSGAPLQSIQHQLQAFNDSSSYHLTGGSERLLKWINQVLPVLYCFMGQDCFGDLRLYVVTDTENTSLTSSTNMINSLGGGYLNLFLRMTSIVQRKYYSYCNQWQSIRILGVHGINPEEKLIFVNHLPQSIDDCIKFGIISATE